MTQRSIGEGTEKPITPPKNKLCLLDPLGRTKRKDRIQGQESSVWQEGGILGNGKSGLGEEDKMHQETVTRIERMVDGLVGG